MSPLTKKLKFKKWRDKWRKKYPEKIRAVKAASQIPLIEGFTRHHWNYNSEYYKDIIWVTPQDHKVVHTKIIYVPSLRVYTTLKGELLDTKEKHISYINKFIKN